MSTDATSSPRAALQVDPATLPDDAALLKSLVAQLFAELQSRDGRISDLEHRMSLLLRKLYGSKSEKLDPRQTSLFDLLTAAAEGPSAVADDAPLAAADDNSADETPAATSTTKQRPGHGRRRLPDQLQRREVEHDLTAPEKEALGGAANLVVIGREVTEQLEWEPSCLYVIRHVQLTYARRQLLPESGLTLAEQNVVTASETIDKLASIFAPYGQYLHREARQLRSSALEANAIGVANPEFHPMAKEGDQSAGIRTSKSQRERSQEHERSKSLRPSQHRRRENRWGFWR